MTALTERDVLKGREVFAPLNQEQRENLVKLLHALNELQELWGSAFTITSGYRPASVNSTVGGAKKSAHLNCQAADIRDINGTIGHWLKKNVDILEELELYLEEPSYTKGWCHVQIRPTKNRVFIPY